MKDNNTYVRVSFHIHIPEYMRNEYTEDVKKRFFQEFTEILTKLNFNFSNVEPLKPGYCPEGERGFENLYCHPTSINGYISIDHIEEVNNALSAAKSFNVWKVDTYEQVKNYTADEFMQELYNRHDQFVKSILETFMTSNDNLYLHPSSLLNISIGITIKPMSRGDHLRCIARDYIQSVFYSLVESGKIVTAQTKSGIGYRTVREKSRRKSRAAS